MIHRILAFAWKENYAQWPGELPIPQENNTVFTLAQAMSGKETTRDLAKKTGPQVDHVLVYPFHYVWRNVQARCKTAQLLLSIGSTSVLSLIKPLSSSKVAFTLGSHKQR